MNATYKFDIMHINRRTVRFQIDVVRLLNDLRSHFLPTPALMHMHSTVSSCLHMDTRGLSGGSNMFIACANQAAAAY